MQDDRKELETKVFNWIEIAEEDLVLARHAFTLESDIPYRLIGFHSQQCAEKYLKAFLVSKLIDFPYTHNIQLLTNLCNEVVDINEKIKEAFILSQYAIAKRYPGEYRSLTKQEAEEAVKPAELVKEIITELLKKMVLIIKINKRDRILKYIQL